MSFSLNLNKVKQVPVAKPKAVIRAPDPKPTPIETIVTSHSIDGTFESCARRFEFLHVHMRAPEKESDAYAADVGTAIHEATQEWQRAVFLKQPNAREIGQLTLLRWWPWAVEDQRRKEGKAIGRRTLGNSLLMLDAIMDDKMWDQWELVEVEGFGPAIEVPWRIVHRSLGLVPTPRGTQAYFITQGKIDFILRHKRLGMYRIVDLKTTMKSLPAHDAAFRFSGQGGQYGMVLSHALGIDWKSQGLDVTYLIAYFGEEESMIYPLDYHLDPDEVQDAIDVKLDRLHRMRDYALHKHWPRRSHGCEFFGTPCGFLDICVRRDEDFVTRWFDFEVASGRFHKYERTYDPIWTLEA